RQPREDPMTNYATMQRKRSQTTRALPPDGEWRPAAPQPLPDALAHAASRQSNVPEAAAALTHRYAHLPLYPPAPVGETANPAGETAGAGVAPVQRFGPGWRGGPAADLGARIRAAAGGGAALPSDVQRRLEHGLSADLSGVRLHTDGEADQLSRAVSAVAFTSGPDIFF